MAIVTRLTTSGNSKALRLTHDLLAMSQVGDVVEVEVSPGQIVIRKAKNPRLKWRDIISQDLNSQGPLAETDEFGSLEAEREATLADGLDV